MDLSVYIKDGDLANKLKAIKDLDVLLQKDQSFLLAISTTIGMTIIPLLSVEII